MVSGSGSAVRPVALDDRDAFATWIRPHWDGLSRLARRLAPAGEWEDVLQDALTAAWRKRAQFDAERGTARNWLLAIVADQARKGHRRASRPAVRSAVEQREDEVADPDLERVLTGLTVRQRTVVVLHYYLGLPVADVAEVLTCSVGTVKSTLSDARARLRRELGEDYR
ncbi:MAG TPA: RNA polymerase sigma factor [Mycobacteriales bacterium]|jgi:RNA polymerase sigma-70 factor (ECF subfamily)|nr:RNA polymerase sigma factor [Mycobacteriales bacterium]